MIISINDQKNKVVNFGGRFFMVPDDGAINDLRHLPSSSSSTSSLLTFASRAVSISAQASRLQSLIAIGHVELTSAELTVAA